MFFHDGILSINMVKQAPDIALASISSSRHAISKLNGSVDFQPVRKMKLVLLWTFNYYSKEMNLDKRDIAKFQCGEYKCGVTKNRKHLSESHVVIFNPTFSHVNDLPSSRKPWQRWALQVRESPNNVHFQSYFNNKINWTITYHHQSDVSLVWGFYVPKGNYEQGPYFIPDNLRHSMERSGVVTDDKEIRSLVRNKTLSALWIASNCGVLKRNNYVKEMKKGGIKLDVYGRCGRADPCKRDVKCLNEMFSKYKFYIAFENSFCEDYISEKLWKALNGRMVPIVMGYTIESYERSLPPDSFLHVDNFTTVHDLIKYVQFLDSNDDAYFRYHQWRKHYEIVPVIAGTQNNINLWICDLCKKIEEPTKLAYKDISSRWNSQKMCRK